MHRLMECYGKPLIIRGEECIFDNLISQLRKQDYDEDKVCGLEDYAIELRKMLMKCPAGFYHADMHSGNTKYRNGQFTWMDFDKACMSYNVMDFGWLLETDWVCFHDESLERSRCLFDEVYAGYSTERTLIANEITAVFHSVAMVHYEALSIETKIRGNGLEQWLIDREYEWLMRWRECCDKLLQ